LGGNEPEVDNLASRSARRSRVSLDLSVQQKKKTRQTTKILERKRKQEKEHNN
jgi:hypothetical protein